MQQSYQKQQDAIISQSTALFSGMVTNQLVLAAPSVTFNSLITDFCNYAAYDLILSPETVAKYKESLGWLLRYLPHVSLPQQITLMDITDLKKQMIQKGLSVSRVNSILFALRKFLFYCNEIHKLVTIKPEEIKTMKVPKRQVIFLTKEEINQFINSINVESNYGLRMRALTELLIASGMRISEALNLNKDSINFETKEATVIGKGNKERVIFVTDRVVEWLQKYISMRKDNNPALFVAFGSTKRLTRFDLGKEFRRYGQKAGIKKKVHPHMLRHSMATLMLHNGANIMDIKELLGHADIKTTATYYLGTDKRALKASHEKYANFEQ